MNGITRDQAQPLRELVYRQSANNMKIITVASGKGGVGKSSISVNLAIALTRLGIRTLVIDADFGLANVDVMLGVSSRYNLSHLLRGEKNISEIIQEGYQGVRFISGGSGVYELLQMDEDQLSGIMRGLMQMNNPADVILFDTGAGINDNVIRLTLESSETIIVTTPEPTAILDAYALVKTIVKHNNSHMIRLIMNKCDSKKEAETAISGFLKVTSKHLGANVEPLGHVLYDQEVSRSIKQMTPIMMSSPNCGTSRDIMKIAKSLMDLPAPPPQKNIISKLFARFLGQ